MKAFLRRAASPTVLLLALFAVVALATWWMVARADRELRAGLLQQTQTVAQMVDAAVVKSLSGTEADTGSPAYLKLKKQFGGIRSSIPKCRFVYLMGRKADGRVFFFVDDQPVGGKDEAPAGMIYNEASAEFRHVFDTGLPMTEGPYTDQWGTFFSGVVPITDPATGAVLAALGMDIDANAWKRDVAAKVALPVGLLLVLLIIAATAWASARRVDASPKPVMWRLLPPLVAMVILMLAGAGAIVYQQQKHQLDREIAANISDVAGDLSVTLKQQATGLAATAQTIAADPTAQMALREGDADRLLATWGPVFETLKQESHLTHFYFFDKNRVCLLRIQKPEKRGDRIERFTALESERTGKTASGIELGPLGTFTLRVVQPVFADGQLVGYVELGKEIEDALQTLNAISGDQLAVVIRKDQLNRPAWEDGMRLLGRDAAWDRMPRHVVIYASQGRMPDAFAAWAHQMPGEPSFLDADRMISFDGKDWRVAAAPLKDVSGKDVGALLIMRDATAANAAIAGLLSLSAAAGMGLLALLVGFIYVLLRRTDAGILAQQASLQESEARMRAITDSAQDAILMMNPEGKVSYWNPAAERIFGYTAAEATGQDLHALIAHSRYHEAHRAALPAFLATGKGAAIGRTLDLTAIRKDGQEIEVQLSLSALQLGGLWHSVGIVRDVTESTVSYTHLTLPTIYSV